VTALPPTPTDWPLWAWDMLRERAAIHEAEGLTPHDARIKAEQEVRVWVRSGGDAALMAALPPRGREHLTAIAVPVKRRVATPRNR
jgi:hypothetical protein